MKKLLGMAAVVLFIALDQITKYYAKLYLEPIDSIPLIPNVFSLKYLENRGAAFGLMQNQRLFFILITITILILLCGLYVRIPSKKRYIPMKAATILIIAGAIGNFIDRLRLKYVIDFLYFELIDFPIFNVADCYVTIAVILLAGLLLFYYKEEELEFISWKKKTL